MGFLDDFFGPSKAAVQSQSDRTAVEQADKQQLWKERGDALAYQQLLEKLAKEQGFSAGEAEKTRGFTAGESDKQRAFSSGESEKERAARTAVQELIGAQNIGLQKSKQDYELDRLKESLARAQMMSDQGENQLMGQLGSPLPELQRLQDDILSGSTSAQDQQRKQMSLALRQQGVHGGQAANLLGRSMGTLNQNLNKDVNQLAYDEALNRRKAATDFYSQKAQSGQKSFVNPVGGA